jgi:hypothetical protein
VTLLNKRYLVFDISNLLYRTFFAHKSEEDITVAGLAHHTALLTLNKYYRQFKPDKVIMAFDRPSWRKEYTQSEACLSKKPYKGNRRQKMTPKEKAKYELFLKNLAEFEDMIRNHTSIIALAGEQLEADDLVSGFVQVKSLEDDSEIIIVSGDKDMIQLLGYPRVRLIDPATGKDRTLDEWDGDAELFLFEKCLRGDLGDNVMSAYPRVRSTRIMKAYKDELERQNMMHEQWTAPDGRTFVVKEVFKENQLLMDLRCQPPEIQKRIIQTVLHALENTGTYSYFHFMRFLGKFELKKLAEQAEQFAHLLSR